MRTRKERLAFSSEVSPREMAAWAVALAGLHVACRLAGWEQYTCILSGMRPPAGGPTMSNLLTTAGGAYVITYFLCVVVAPILLGGAGLLALVDCLGKAVPYDVATYRSGTRTRAR